MYEGVDLGPIIEDLRTARQGTPFDTRLVLTELARQRKAIEMLTLWIPKEAAAGIREILEGKR